MLLQIFNQYYGGYYEKAYEEFDSKGSRSMRTCVRSVFSSLPGEQ